MSVRFALIKKELVVPLPIYQAGYYSRKEPATAIHDPLNISCFYLENDEKAVAVFGLDLLGIYDDYYEKLCERVQETIKRPDLQIVFSCAHTHAAPGFGRMTGEDLNKDKLLQEIVDKAVAILIEAPKIAKPATLTYGEKPLDDVGANRRDKDVKVNTILRTLAFDFEDKKAMVVNFNCHPTHMSFRNLLISKDYQGAAMDELLTQGYLPMFLQGACGDISTRFTRIEQTFEDMARIAHLFAEDIKTVNADDVFTVEDFDYQEYTFAIPKKKYEVEAYYKSEISKYEENLAAARGTMPAAELRLLETALEGISVEYQCSTTQDEIVTAIRCGILRLDDKLAMVFLPFELFSKIADQITAGSKVPHTMIVGYTFDGLGYLPDIASYEKSGYEVLSCTYEKGAGEKVADRVIALLNQ